jgi:hypothetical protein
VVDSAGRTLVIWEDDTNNDTCGLSLFYRVSLDNGETWQPYGSLTNAQLGGISSLTCLIEGDIFIIAWDDLGFSNCDYTKEAISYSTDFGVTWEAPQFVTGPVEGDEIDPALAYTIQDGDAVIHYVYSKDIPGRRLFYVRDHDFVGIDDPNKPNKPGAIGLKAYPNPFNSSTLISFSIIRDNEIKIFDIRGSLVKILRPEQKENGSVVWDATDEGGQMVSSGVYFARASSGGNSKTIKLIYLK